MLFRSHLVSATRQRELDRRLIRWLPSWATWGYLATLLKPGGLLFLHTPNIEFQLPKAKLKKLLRGMRPDLHYIEAKDHVNIFSPKTLTMLLERNGFNDLQFTHLKPVQSVSGSKSGLLKLAKNLWFYSAVALHRASLGSINVDNLFVAARKQNAESVARP